MAVLPPLEFAIQGSIHFHSVCFARVFLPTGVILYKILECGNSCQERQHLSVRVFLSAVELPDYIIVLSRPFPRTSSVSETVLCLTF